MHNVNEDTRCSLTKTGFFGNLNFAVDDKLNSYVIFLLLLSTVVRTRSQLEKLSKGEIIGQVLTLQNFRNEINTKFEELNDRFNDF